MKNFIIDGTIKRRAAQIITLWELNGEKKHLSNDEKISIAYITALEEALSKSKSA
jgi:hypothetical protein